MMENEENYGLYTTTYEYDLIGNRTSIVKTDEAGAVAEYRKYVYNESSQVVKAEIYDGKKTTSMVYTYDADGNMISEIGKIGTDKVETYYDYAVENRLAAVYEADELLVAMAYDGDGNRVFQLNYNLHTDEDWKANNGNGNGSNKDNSGSSNSSSNGSGNTTNAEENTSQNQSGILFPIDGEVSDTEQGLIDLIKTTGKQKNYELIEYINDVNREYAEVLVEQNINGKTDASYVYGVDRLSLDRFDGSTGYYLYDPRGSVTGITNEEGQLYQSYRYGAYGEITFGAPQYENEYTYNGESYNPNIESQYLRARYYYVVTATFLTEDSYLGNIVEPLTLNRYIYCVSSPLNYIDPSGYWIHPIQAQIIYSEVSRDSNIRPEDKDEAYRTRMQYLDAIQELGSNSSANVIDNAQYVLNYNYKNQYYKKIIELAEDRKKSDVCELGDVIEGKFIGYLAYGANGIVDNSNDGFFALYDAATLLTSGERYDFSDLYKQYGVDPYGALQSFGGKKSGLNKNGESNYGNQTYNAEQGTLYYNGIERYGIAIGPKLQNPEYDLSSKIDPKDMAYGTCVDIVIQLEGKTYYIPAIIVDVKAHSAPTGIFQTGDPFVGGSENTGKAGPIVEWYVIKTQDGKNKSTGLSNFNSNASIIIYRDEVLE